jgi:hypothetical protein
MWYVVSGSIDSIAGLGTPPGHIQTTVSLTATVPTMHSYIALEHSCHDATNMPRAHKLSAMQTNLQCLGLSGNAGLCGIPPPAPPPFYPCIDFTGTFLGYNCSNYGQQLTLNSYMCTYSPFAPDCNPDPWRWVGERIYIHQFGP